MEAQDIQYHFTYSKPEKDSDLSQGDILEKTDELKNILAQVHPHYLKNDYTHFIVLTQTCDLVRRDGNDCSSRYIVLAAIRPIETVIEREISKRQVHQIEQIGKLCSIKHRQKIQDFVSSLMNNNKDEYFYLHEDSSFNFTQPSCAFLRLAISIRSKDHYQTCLKARIISLEENFRAKLGFNVGHLYSRVGTKDWVPEVLDLREFNKIVSKYVEKTHQWVEDKILEEAIKELNDPEYKTRLNSTLQKIQDENLPLPEFEKTVKEARDFIKLIKTEKPIDIVSEKIVSILENEFNIQFTTSKEKLRFIQTLKNDVVIKKHVKT